MGRHGGSDERDEMVGPSYWKTVGMLRDVGASVGDTVTVEYISTTSGGNSRITGTLLGVTPHGATMIEYRRLYIWRRRRQVGSRSLVSVELP